MGAAGVVRSRNLVRILDGILDGEPGPGTGDQEIGTARRGSLVQVKQ